MKIEQVPFFGDLLVAENEIEEMFYSTFPDADKLFGNHHTVQMAIWVSAWEASRQATIDRCVDKVKSLRYSND